MSKNSVIPKSPKVMGYTAVFQGTRVPIIKNRMDYLPAGQDLYEFLRGFPAVTKVQITDKGII
jgi:uncharacterized protein (DUF433 family)